MGNMVGGGLKLPPDRTLLLAGDKNISQVINCKEVEMQLRIHLPAWPSSNLKPHMHLKLHLKFQPFTDAHHKKRGLLVLSVTSEIGLHLLQMML